MSVLENGIRDITDGPATNAGLFCFNEPMNVAQINAGELDIDMPNAKLAYTIIQSLLDANECLSDLLVVMAHALDEDVTKALTLTGEWQKYLESKRDLETTKEQIEKFVQVLRSMERSELTDNG